MRSLATLALALSLLACDRPVAEPKIDPVTDPVLAANLFTHRYATSRMSSWNVRAAAAGPQCDILRVQVDMVLESSMVAAMHYGQGAYDIYPGGVGQFAAERGFRGVVYHDSTGRQWTYGAVPRSLQPCRD